MDSLGPLRKFYEPKDAPPLPVAEPVKRDWLDIPSTIKTPACGAALLEMVSSVTGVPINVLKSSTRQIKACRARHIFFFVARKYTMLSNPQIGAIAGGRDHSTAMHGTAKVTSNPAFFDPELAICQNLAVEIVSARTNSKSGA